MRSASLKRANRAKRAMVDSADRIRREDLRLSQSRLIASSGHWSTQNGEGGEDTQMEEPVVAAAEEEEPIVVDGVDDAEPGPGNLQTQACVPGPMTQNPFLPPI